MPPTHEGRPKRSLVFPAVRPTDLASSIQERTLGVWTVLGVSGELGWPATRGLRRLLSDTPALRIVVDLGGVDYVDHTCLATLVHGHLERRASGGEIRLVSPPPSTLLLLRMSSGQDLPEVYPTLADAAVRRG